MGKINIVPNASGAGTFTIASPDSATDRTFTLPDSDGTPVMADQSGNATFTGTVSASSLNLTTGLTVPNGGTGAGTFTTNGIIYGNGTSALAATTAGTSGQVLTSNGSESAPTFQDAAGGGGGWYSNIAVIEYNNDYFNGGADGSVPNLTGGSGSWTYTIPAETLFVIVIGAGGAGNGTGAGGTCSFGAYISATGGQGAGTFSNTVGAIGGLGSGGDINLRGAMGGNVNGAYVAGNNINQAPMWGGTTYGYGGGGQSTHDGWGAAGGYAQKQITGLTIGNTVAVTVPNFVWDGGYDNTYRSHQGGQGVCIIMY